ncbi:MAG TPA: prephenate dehydrogenase/arogenate dehydrogenase family protein, partial [Desulforhopalus sp.]|nr:prephenate dehydrogenase/arogenate dehydrogenase family protein [Desulforhopalus sp.]
MTLREHALNYDDLNSHSTLTSLYGILAMARVHNQNPRTYAEIMATGGDGGKIVRSLTKNLNVLIEHDEQSNIAQLSTIMDENKKTMPPAFLQNRMKQARAVDELISTPAMKST